MEYVFDPYTWEDDRKILTQKELIVPGLEMFGTHHHPKKLRILPPHMHKTTEFLYLANGAQKYYVGEKEYLLTGNHVLVVNNDVVHSTGDIPYGRYENLWFRLDIPRFAKSLGVPAPIRSHICQRLQNLPHPLISMTENRFSQLRDAFFALSSDLPSEKLQGYAQFVDFVTYLVKCTDPTAAFSADIQQVLSYIREHICESILLADLAALCRISLSTFKQKFRRETGVSPREYINIQKIEKAKVFLASGMTVTETAYALDFSSSSYFSVVFKQMEDISPIDWQAKHTNDPKNN